MMETHIKVVAMNRENVLDRLELCWGHLDDWRHLEIVQKSRTWLEKANASFTPTTFLAYESGVPVGMIEFIPQKLIRTLGLCPCRVDVKNKEIPERYILQEEFKNYLFISCLLVSKDHQGKGVGKTLLNHFLGTQVLKNGALVYVTKRDERWSRHIHWPTGPKEFFLKAGFVIEKTLHDPEGFLLFYRR